jgi:molybdate transport system regulatory protein
MTFMKTGALKIRISHRAAVAMGPGKADLIEAIDHCGSISAAAKHMGMSYRRAWELVDAMNHCFAQPLIATHPGGGKQGGAQVTELGFHILHCYRTLIAKTQSACEQELDEIARYLTPAE